VTRKDPDFDTEAAYLDGAGDAVPMPLGYVAGLSALAPLLGMDPEDVR